MRLTIAVATWRGERFLEKQLDSLRLQNRLADEVIFSDDSSPDSTAEMIEAYIEKYNLTGWKLLRHSQNLGFIDNFRAAFKEATGDIIFPCDQDDIWEPDKLEVMEQVFLDHPNAMAVNGSFVMIDAEDNPITPPPYPKGSYNHGLIYYPVEQGGLTQIPFSYIIRGNMNLSPGCTMAVRRKLLDYYLSRSKGEIPHDLELNIYAAQIGELYYLDQPVIRYRLHGNNTIGLETEQAGTLEVRGNLDGRQKLFSQEEKFLSFLQRLPLTKPEDQRFAKHYAAYVKIRRQCLYYHNPFAWFLYWLHYPALRPEIKPRTLLGDLLYAFGKR